MTVGQLMNFAKYGILGWLIVAYRWTVGCCFEVLISYLFTSILSKYRLLLQLYIVAYVRKHSMIMVDCCLYKCNSDGMGS